MTSSILSNILNYLYEFDLLFYVSDSSYFKVYIQDNEPNEEFTLNLINTDNLYEETFSNLLADDNGFIRVDWDTTSVEDGEYILSVLTPNNQTIAQNIFGVRNNVYVYITV